jgi:tRNA threonylcarbamoyladenosine modification (KEOPS) complex  Pcc1 subunit
VSTSTLDLISKIEVQIRFAPEKLENLEKIYSSIFPEFVKWPKGNTTVKLHKEKQFVCAYIQAKSLSEIRAALNTIHSWLYIAARILGENV